MIKENCSDILVYMETNGGQIKNIGFEMLGKAIELSKTHNLKVNVAVIGTIKKDSLNGYGINKAYVFDDEKYDIFNPILYSNALIKCVEYSRPKILLIGSSLEGRSIAPRVAVRFNTGLTADCTDLDIDQNDYLIQTRPAFGENLIAEIITPNSYPQMSTVREKIFAKAKIINKLKPQFEYLIDSVKDNEKQISIEGVNYSNNNDILENAKRIVVIGGGVKSKEDVALFEKFTTKIDGVLCSSRALVEKGFMSSDKQIGLSGKSVSPNTLITFGVSGSEQFCVGIKNAKTIIAVCNDRNANICKIANYAIIEDMYKIVEKLNDKI